jgi:hypothetical protein
LLAGIRAPARTELVNSNSNDSKRGRPRTLGKEYSSEAERKRVERLRNKWLAELRLLRQQQRADDRAVISPGYLTEAPKGRGKTVSGFGSEKRAKGQNEQFERIIGASSRTGLLKSFQGFTEVLDAYHDLGKLQEQIDQHLANPKLNPSVRSLLENSSADDVRSILTETTYTGNTGGSTGDRVNTAAPSVDDGDNHVKTGPGSVSTLGGSYSDQDRVFNSRIDACLRKLRDDPRFCAWSEELNEQDQPLGYVCQICHTPLGFLGAYAVASHFLNKHVKETRKFFREHQVPFRKRYLLSVG